MHRLIFVPFILLGFLTTSVTRFSFCYGEPNILCHEREMTALLTFKQGLTDHADRLSSWAAEEDCCKWKAVECDNITGNVIKLDLQSSQTGYENITYRIPILAGEINSSLLELRHLEYLDLSWNIFKGFPEFLGSLKSLRYLILRGSRFDGMIPYQLGNLTNLIHLDLSANNLWVHNLWWLSHLSSLKYLDLSFVNLQRVSGWLQVVNKLSSLVELHLSYCSLDSIPPSLGYVNFTSLSVLDLSDNYLEYTIPTWFYNLSSLSHLILYTNTLQGQIPDELRNLNSLEYLNLAENKLFQVKSANTLWNLCNLKVLDLSFNHFSGESIGSISNVSTCIGKSLEGMYLMQNQLTGHIPDWFGQLFHLENLLLSFNSFFGPIPASLGNLSSLRRLDLYQNQLCQSLPETFGQLSNLEELNLGSNALNGFISEAHFTKLSKLKFLDMSANSFNFTILPYWLPPFQLETLDISQSKIVNGFPTWLRTQNSLRYLDMSSAGISDLVPNWFWDFASQIHYFSLSDNQLRGDLSNALLKSPQIDLSSNHFTGQLPHLSPDVEALILYKNSFSGSLTPLLCECTDEKKSLMYLDLSKNHLSGELPQCWMYWKNLIFVDLKSNNFSGNIPSSMGSLHSLQSLHLRNNSISGDLPSALQNCKQLEIIDLGENVLSGSIPSWIGECLTDLIILSLRSNKFSGSIPQQICNLTSLQVLDLAHNSLSQAIPRCLDYITAMITEKSTERRLSFNLQGRYYFESLLLVTKGTELEYTTILRLVKSVDLSSNKLNGEIPHELSSLSGLHFLNLSGNCLNGNIPENIGGLKCLESLDFSRNHLSGAIPQSLANLTFLSFLNLSFNNLSGTIPSGTQLQSFSEDSFAGNPELCGVPLLKICPGDLPIVIGEDKDDGHMLSWFSTSVVSGFVSGFWGVCGILFFKKSWRYAYFRFMDKINDQIYVAIALKLGWLRKNVKRNQGGE